MDWQDYTVWGILMLAVAAVVRGVFRKAAAARRGDCDSCCSKECPRRKR